MDADTPHGEDAATRREPSAPSGWVTTQQAARSLGISTRTVRWHIERGNLEAKAEGEGVNKSWLVSIDSLQAFRDSRQRQALSPGDYRAQAGTAEGFADIPGNPVRELADRLAEEATKVGEFRARLELSERAQSTLEGELAEERRRREQAERDLQRIRAEMEALKTAPGAPEAGEEEPQEATTAPGDEPADGNLAPLVAADHWRLGDGVAGGLVTAPEPHAAGSPRPTPPGLVTRGFAVGVKRVDPRLERPLPRQQLLPLDGTPGRLQFGVNPSELPPDLLGHGFGVLPHARILAGTQ